LEKNIKRSILRFLKPDNYKRTEVMRGNQNNYSKFQKILSIKNRIASSPIRCEGPGIIMKIVEPKDFYWPDAKGVEDIEHKNLLIKEIRRKL